jgi:hypothetical protein
MEEVENPALQVIVLVSYHFLFLCLCVSRGSFVRKSLPDAVSALSLQMLLRSRDAAGRRAA